MSDNIIEGELYFAEVKLFSGKYHIFKEGKNVCLCGRYSLPSDLKDEDKVRVKGDEKLQKGDCKTCFKKAKLIIPEVTKG